MELVLKEKTLLDTLKQMIHESRQRGEQIEFIKVSRFEMAILRILTDTTHHDLMPQSFESFMGIPIVVIEEHLHEIEESANTVPGL